MCGSCFRLCPSDPAIQCFGSSGELKRAWEDICQSVREFTRVVEVNRKYWGLTGQRGAVGKRALAGKRVRSIQQTGSMAHVLMNRGLVRDYANSAADDLAAMGSGSGRASNLTGRPRDGRLETFASAHDSLCPTNTFMFTDGCRSPVCGATRTRQHS